MLDKSTSDSDAPDYDGLATGEEWVVAEVNGLLGAGAPGPSLGGLTAAPAEHSWQGSRSLQIKERVWSLFVG